jgi:hypothetical protein
MTLKGGSLEVMNWWYAIAFVIVMVMFFRNLYLWRLAVNSTSSTSDTNFS